MFNSSIYVLGFSTITRTSTKINSCLWTLLLSFLQENGILLKFDKLFNLRNVTFNGRNIIPQMDSSDKKKVFAFGHMMERIEYE